MQAQAQEKEIDPPGAATVYPRFLIETNASTSVANANSSASESESEPVPVKPGSGIQRKHGLLKNFDVVSDYSDHHHKSKNSRGGFWGMKETPEWTKKIQSEWKLLEKELPESIFVRVYEERIDLMRAVIVGAPGTPYHDGLFFFDILYPSNYPSKPPAVYYHSGGLRLNPNLYECGTVLLSIQALILNEKPYFNEPGYGIAAGTVKGEKKSTLYSENAFILSCRTMMYSLNRPPKRFEDIVKAHFCERADAILGACKSYISGAQVGFPFKYNDKKSPSFKKSVEEIFPRLLTALSKGGADCGKFTEKPARTARA